MRHNDTLKTVQGHKTIRWLRTSLAKFTKIYRTHDVRHDVRRVDTYTQTTKEYLPNQSRKKNKQKLPENQENKNKTKQKHSRRPSIISQSDHNSRNNRHICS